MPGHGPFLCSPAPSRLPFVRGRGGLAGHSSESPGEAKSASDAQFASTALPWSLQPPYGASSRRPAAAPRVTGLSGEQGGTGVRAGVQRSEAEPGPDACPRVD